MTLKHEVHKALKPGRDLIGLYRPFGANYVTGTRLVILPQYQSETDYVEVVTDNGFSEFKFKRPGRYLIQWAVNLSFNAAATDGIEVSPIDELGASPPVTDVYAASMQGNMSQAGVARHDAAQTSGFLLVNIYDASVAIPVYYGLAVTTPAGCTFPAAWAVTAENSFITISHLE